MNKLISLISFLLIVQFVNAQIFQKTYGETGFDVCRSVQQTTDGGYVIAAITAYFPLGAGSYDVYLIKTDANGDSLWTRTFGGSGEDWGNCIQQTTDSGYIIAGYTSSFGAGGYDVNLIKTDVSGNLIWTKTFGGTGNDYGYSVRQTTDGGYIIAGYTVSFGAGGYDIYLIKTDANGDSLWTKAFGGNDSDIGYSVQQTTDGGYAITGYTYSFGAGSYDVYLIKTNSNGDTLWTKTFGSTGSDFGQAVQQTTDGGYIITGLTEISGMGSGDMGLIKTDVNGDLLWTKAFGGTGWDAGGSVQQTTDGGFIIAGMTNSFGAGGEDAYLIKTNANGDSIWTKTYGGTTNDRGSSVQQTTDGGYIIAGFTGLVGNSLDVYLLKTDSLGNAGCNQGSATIITIPPTQVTSPATIVSSTNTIVTIPAPIVGSGGMVITPCTNVAINEVENINSFTVYPNPSPGNFVISFEKKIAKGNIEILNILGEKVYLENIFNVSKKEIKLKNILQGMYFVKVFDGEKSYCKKLIVE